MSNAIGAIEIIVKRLSSIGYKLPYNANGIAAEGK